MMITRTLSTPARPELNEPVKLPKLLEAPASPVRRQFLAAAAAVPAVAVCALLSRPRAIPVTAPPAAIAEPLVNEVGYHETDHVRRYYYSAAYF